MCFKAVFFFRYILTLFIKGFKSSRKYPTLRNSVESVTSKILTGTLNHIYT